MDTCVFLIFVISLAQVLIMKSHFEIWSRSYEENVANCPKQYSSEEKVRTNNYNFSCKQKIKKKKKMQYLGSQFVQDTNSQLRCHIVRNSSNFK